MFAHHGGLVSDMVFAVSDAKHLEYAQMIFCKPRSGAVDLFIAAVSL